MSNKRISSSNKIVHILHCVDTEGPLYESLEATFDRLYELYNIKLEPDEEKLKKIQNGLIDFGDNTATIAETFNKHNLKYNDSWEKIDKMLVEIMAPAFRNKLLDSFGNGWVYNWFCVDHVGFKNNPRRRTLGFHKIFDHYKNILGKTNIYQDEIQWHFHPMSIYQDAHRSGVSYLTTPYIYEILCKRIIERKWFPSVFRAGFHTERPDSNWFLEQWIPFDASNWSYNEERGSFSHQNDMIGGRFKDWRLAPDDWSIYHPSHDNYQILGNCRRWICRALDLRIRNKILPQREVDKAFARANEGEPTIMGITNHDERDMLPEVEEIREKIILSSKKYPDVKFKFCGAKEAFLSAIYGNEMIDKPVDLTVTLDGNRKRLFLYVETKEGKVFGPQPFLSVKTKSGRFIHDNFDFDTSLTKWSYTFDHESIHADDVAIIGVACNDRHGNTFVKVINVD